MQQQLGSKKDKLSKLRPNRPDVVQNQEEEEFQKDMQELIKLKEKNLEMARAIGELESSINIMSDVRNNELIYQEYLQRRMQIEMAKYVIKEWSRKKGNIDHHQIQQPQPSHIIALNSPRRIAAEPQRIIDYPQFSLKEQRKLMKNQPDKSQKNILCQNDQLQEKKQKIQEKPKPKYDQKQINSSENPKDQLPEKNLVSNQSKVPADSVKNPQKIPQRAKTQLFPSKPNQDKQNEKTGTFNQSRQPIQKQLKNQNNQTLNRSSNQNQPAQNLHQPPNNQSKQNKQLINRPNPQNQQVQSLHQVQNKSSNQNNRLTTALNQPAQPQIKRSQSTGFSLAQPLNSFFNMLIGGSRGAPIVNNQKANDQNRLNIDNKSKANVSQPKDHNVKQKIKDQEKKQKPNGSIFGALQKKPEPKTDNRPKWR